MLSLKRKINRIRPAFKLSGLGLLAFVTACALSACTVQPLYQGRDNNGAVQLNVAPTIKEKLSQVNIAATNDRFTQIVRNELFFLLYGGKNPPANAQYELALNANYFVREAVRVDIGDNTDLTGRASAGNAVGRGDYILKDLQGKILNKASRTVYAPFDRPRQEYANLQAENDAMQRSAKELAEQLFLALAQNISKL